jgi:rubrerythrin
MLKREKKLFGELPVHTLFWCDKCDHVWSAGRNTRRCPMCGEKLNPRTKERDDIAMAKYKERYGTV